MFFRLSKKLGSLITLLCGLYLVAQTPAASYLSELKTALAQSNKADVDRITARMIASDASQEELLTAGGVLGGQDYFEQSTLVFDHCAAKYPKSFEARYNLALANLALHREDKAQQALNSVTAASAEEQLALQYLRGKIDAATGRLKEAHDNLQAAFNARPEQENYALDLALLDLRTSAYVPAIMVLQRASAYHPEVREIQLELALAYALAGRTTDAIDLCNKLENARDSVAVPILIGAFARCSSGDYQGCSQEAARGFGTSHSHPYLHYLHAMAQWNQPAPNQAAILDELTLAVTQLPACVVCLQLRSRVYEAVGNYHAAIADLEKITLGDKASAAAWYRLSELYRKVGDNNKSAGAMRRYRAIHALQQNEEVKSLRDQIIGAP